MRPPQVFAVQFDQVEGDQHRIDTVTIAANKAEHRQATLLGDNSLAVEQE